MSPAFVFERWAAGGGVTIGVGSVRLHVGVLESELTWNGYDSRVCGASLEVGRRVVELRVEPSVRFLDALPVHADARASTVEGSGEGEVGARVLDARPFLRFPLVRRFNFRGDGEGHDERDVIDGHVPGGESRGVLTVPHGGRES